MPPLTHSAGPPAHPLWGHLAAFRRDPADFLTHCARNYGAVVPLRFAHVRAALLLDPDDIERVLVTAHRDFVKPAWLRTPAVRRLLGDGLVVSDGETWRSQRQASQPAFHPRRMAAYGDEIAAAGDRMLVRWESGQVRSLQRDMSELTLEVVARALIGVDMPGWTGNAADAMDTLMARFTSGAGLFGMAPLPPGIGEMRAVRTLNRIADSLIAQSRTLSGAASQPMCGGLVALLDATTHSAAANVERHSVRDQIKTFLGAGYESSALTLTWAFLLLAASPDTEAALHGEVDSVLAGRTPAAEDMAELPYTEAVIKETLRLYPPLWMTGRQSAKRCEFGGIEVEAGALVMTSQWAVQRNPGYFTAPDAFRPERWLNGETAGLPRFAYFPFGGGPRVCIGQSFAMTETVLLLATIARRFRLEPVTGVDLRPWATMTLRPPPGLLVRLVERKRA